MGQVALLITILGVFFTLEGWAEESDKPKEEKSTWESVVDHSQDYGEKAYQVGKKAVQTTNKKLGSSRQNRIDRNHAVFFNYSMVDTWIPSKYGLAYSYIPNESDTWEIDWNHSSLAFDVIITDLGKMTEDRFTLMRKSYSKRNSFYFSYGVNYYNFEAFLGEKFLSKVTNTQPLALDLIQISSLGLSFGLGNRWHFKNWVIGFDWFTIHVPVVVIDAKAPYLEYASDENDRKTVEDTIDILKRVPNFTALKFQIGYSF